MKIASFALCCLSFMASSSAAYAGFDDSCVSPQEMSGVAANRAWVSEAVKSTCAPFEAKDLEKSPACVRQMSGYSLKTCSPLCASRHGQSGSGLYFRVSSEANGACMENRHNFVVGTHPSAIADAYRDRMLDEYKSNVRDRLKLTVSRLERLERLVTSPDSEGLMVGDRPLRDVFGETLNSARSFMEEMQGLMESDTLSAERREKARSGRS
jgi:hypothetical protein